MPKLVYAGRTTIGERYITRGGWPILILEMGPKSVMVKNGLTGERHKIDPQQLLWNYSEKLISREAIQMAKAKGHSRKAAHAPKQSKSKEAKVHIPSGDFVREYKGREYAIKRQGDQFVYDGETYKSLTALALKITGYKAISGPDFFKHVRTAEPVAS